MSSSYAQANYKPHNIHCMKFVAHACLCVISHVSNTVQLLSWLHTVEFLLWFNGNLFSINITIFITNTIKPFVFCFLNFNSGKYLFNFDFDKLVYVPSVSHAEYFPGPVAV